MKAKPNKNPCNIDESGRLSRRVVFEYSNLLSSETNCHSELFYDALNSELNTLPELQRICLQLYHEEGMSVDDVAQIITLSEFSIRIHLERGLRNLQKGALQNGVTSSLGEADTILEVQAKGDRFGKSQVKNHVDNFRSKGALEFLRLASKWIKSLSCLP